MAQFTRRISLIPLLLAAGCVTDFTIPPGAQITCATDDDCPSPFVCSLALRQCVEAGGDLTPPEIVSGTLSISPDRIASGQSTTITFTSSKTLAQEPVVLVAWGSTVNEERTATLDTAASSGNDYVFTYTAQGDESSDAVEETLASATFELVDGSGLRTRSELPRSIAFDFKPPEVLTDSVGAQLAMATDNPLRQLPGVSIDTLRDGSTFTVSFAVSEPLAETPTVTATGPESLAFVPVTSTGNLYVFEHTVAAGTADGAYTLELSARDLVLNSSTPTIAVAAPGFVVDTTPPTAPDTSSPSLVYTRKPWGDSTDGTAVFELEGGAGSVAACTGVDCPWIFAFDREDADDAGVLGGGRANDDGSFGPIELLRVDRPRVWVGAVDGAGNVSDSNGAAGSQVPVVEYVSWVATLNGKVRGSNLENPHRAERIFSNPGGRAVPPQLVTELDQPEYNALFSTDGTSALSSWIPIWNRRNNFGGPDPVATPAVFDSGRNRLMIFGGGNGGFVTSDQWEWTGLEWEEVGGGANRPASRQNHSLAYDSARGVVVIFGGCEDVTCIVNAQDEGYFDDTWEWDGSSWTQILTPTSPTPRWGASMTYDPVRNYVLLFGGRDNTSGDTSCGAGELSRYCTDTWAYTTWGQAECGEADRPCWRELTPMSPTVAPVARREAAIAFDPSLNQVVMFGGGNLSNGAACGGSSSFCGDAFSWDGTEWQALPPGPEERTGATLAREPGTSNLLLMGGFGPSGCTEASNPYCKSVWRWNGAAWTDATTSDIPVLARNRVGAVYSPISDVLLTFGGFTNETCPDGSSSPCNDLQQYDGTTWTEIGRSGTKNNHGYAREVVLHGGDLQYPIAFQNESFFSGSQANCTGAPESRCIQTFSFIAGGWGEVGTIGSYFPIPRVEAGMVYDSSRDMTLLYGGRKFIAMSAANQRYCQGTTAYCSGSEGFAQWGAGPCGSATAYCWASVDPGGTRYGHSMAYISSTQETVAAFGRNAAGSSVTSVIAYRDCGVNDCWQNISSDVGGGSPANRAHAATAYDEILDRVVVFGGEDGSTLLGDTWTLVPRGSCGEEYCWDELSPAMAPTPRSHATAIYDPTRGRVVLFGGFTEGVEDTSGGLSSGVDGVAELWELVGDEWRLIPAINQPLGRGAPGIVSLPAQRQLLAFSGRVSDRDGAGDSYDWFLNSPDDSTPAFGVDIDWAEAQAGAISSASIAATATGGGQGNNLDPMSTAVASGLDVRAWNVIDGLYEDIQQANTFTPVNPGTVTSSRSNALPLIDGDGIIRLLLAPSGGVGNSHNFPQVTLDSVEVQVDYRVVP